MLCVCVHMQGYVRLQEENGAQRVLEGLSQKVSDDGNIQLCGVDTTLRVLEGKKDSIRLCNTL